MLDSLDRRLTYIMSRTHSKRHYSQIKIAQQRDAIYESQSSKPNGQHSGDSRSGPDSSKQNENSLRILTKNFVALICNAKDRKIELQKAATDLGVAKRRIYDITNVLEGIGYVEKLGKNVMRWVGGESNEQLENESQQLEQQRRVLEEEGRRIEQDIKELKEKLRDSSLHTEGECYLNERDLMQIMQWYGVGSLLVYQGVENDNMYDNQCPENIINQFNIESILDSKHKNTTLYHCQLQPSQRLQISVHHPEPEQKPTTLPQ